MNEQPKLIEVFCPKKIESFEIKKVGFHCQNCQRQVFDYSKRCNGDIGYLSDKEHCGVFNIIQIQPNLHQVDLRKGILKIFFSSIPFLGFKNQMLAQNIEKPKTEQMDSSKTDSILGETNKREARRFKKENQKESRRYYNMSKKRLFIGGKFPFIHLVRYMVVGKVYMKKTDETF